MRMLLKTRVLSGELWVLFARVAHEIDFLTYSPLITEPKGAIKFMFTALVSRGDLVFSPAWRSVFD